MYRSNPGYTQIGKGDDVSDHRKHHARQNKHKDHITPRKFKARQLIRRQRGHDQHADDGHAHIDKRLES